MPTMKDLLKAGYIHPGDELLWKSRVQLDTHRASVTTNGDIRTADGKLHKSPSGALRHLNGGKPVDGWNAWKTAKSGESLAKIRAKFNA
jgi:hypothetical protein